jgi:hypothetical protein
MLGRRSVLSEALNGYIGNAEQKERDRSIHNLPQESRRNWSSNTISVFSLERDYTE